MTNINTFNKIRDSICMDAAQNSRSLTEYLQNCGGLFPTEAINILLQHKKEKILYKLLSANKSLAIDDMSEGPASFLHSSWDFSDQTSQRIAKDIEKRAERSLFLGTPSVAKMLSTSTNHSNHLIIDIDARRLQSLNDINIIQYDISLLSGDEFKEAFDVCVFDPPWYVNNYLHWLDIAFRSCRPGGRVIFPLFGKLTRPSAVDDRKTILDRCSQFGAEIELLPSQALYKIPSFERGILARAGINPVRWKRADVVIVHLSKSSLGDFLLHHCAPAPIVESYRIADKIIEVAMDRHVLNDENLWAEPPSGFEMTTPSMRDEGNRCSNVFVSNGARLICNRPIDIIETMRRISGDNYQRQIVVLENLQFPTHLLAL